MRYRLANLSVSIESSREAHVNAIRLSRSKDTIVFLIYIDPSRIAVSPSISSIESLCE